MASNIIAQFQSEVALAGASAFGVMRHPDGQLEFIGAGEINACQFDSIVRKLICTAITISGKSLVSRTDVATDRL